MRWEGKGGCGHTLPEASQGAALGCIRGWVQPSQLMGAHARSVAHLDQLHSHHQLLPHHARAI